jgi:hypothetical protein
MKQKAYRILVRKYEVRDHHILWLHHIIFVTK